MFDPLAEASKGSSFLKNVSTAREERQIKREQNQAVLLLQNHVRFYLAKKHTKQRVMDFVNANLVNCEKPNAKLTMECIKKALVLLELPKDVEFFATLLKAVIKSLESLKNANPLTLCLNKATVGDCIQTFDELVGKVAVLCEVISVTSHAQRRHFTVIINFLLVLCDATKWGIYSTMSPPFQTVLTHISQSLSHIVYQKNIALKLISALKPFSGVVESSVDSAAMSSLSLFFKGVVKIILSQFEFLKDKDEAMRQQIAFDFFTVGGLSVLTERYTPDSMIEILRDDGIFYIFIYKCGSVENENYKLSAEKCSYVIGNYIHFNSIHLKLIVDQPLTFLTQLFCFLSALQQLLHDNSRKQTNREWHKLFGLVSTRVSFEIDCGSIVLNQIRHLWSIRLVRGLLGDLLDHNSFNKQKQQMAGESFKGDRKKISMKRFLMKLTIGGKNEPGAVDFSDPVAVQTSFACSVYQMAVCVFPQIKTEILAALSYQDLFIPNIWAMICELGPDSGFKVFFEHLRNFETATKSGHALSSTVTAIDLLALFCETTANYIVILDEKELYEDQKVLTLDELKKMGSLLNRLLYRCLAEQLFDASNPSHPLAAVFKAMLTLLSVIRDRDNRRTFTCKDFWLLKDVKLPQLLSDIEKEKKVALAVLHFMPHVVPFNDRVQLFRSFVDKERAALGLSRRDMSDDESVIPPSPPAHLITVRRNRIVEDGFNQLADLPGIVMKRIIRVRFVNEQNLAEAGIDQDGVFKEFIEELTRRVFDPTVGLFASTADNKLYPSYASQIVPNHLQLFEFVGKVLAKALYERILVDVPFAAFFLSQLLGHRHSSSASFSFFDDLPSFDEQLYRSLTYVKHYDGDVDDLELTFSFDKSMLGRTVTFELLPGGSAIRVTNENRILYIHSLANYQMFTMIRDQTAAFLRGFRQVIHQKWLQMFDVDELQMLISGDCSDVDVPDLRRNVIYYGGFHDQHQLVRWLWDVIQNDFTAEERKLFLKFVTSCSKPPLLGFSSLDPPFSIRCVEVADDQDTGDTVGSVIKGFLHIGRNKSVLRLPTASTCFNLLKLPNYPKRSVLKEKLRYAITSKAGFELS